MKFVHQRLSYPLLMRTMRHNQSRRCIAVDDAFSVVKIAPASTSSPEGLCGNESAAFNADRKRLAAAAILAIIGC